jgi:hypothetical protein
MGARKKMSLGQIDRERIHARSSSAKRSKGGLKQVVVEGCVPGKDEYLQESIESERQGLGSVRWKYRCSLCWAQALLASVEEVVMREGWGTEQVDFICTVQIEGQ